jgi:hypothetical protein
MMMSEIEEMAAHVFRIQELIRDLLISHAEDTFPGDVENQVMLIKHTLCSVVSCFTSVSIEDSDLDKFYSLLRSAHEIAKLQMMKMENNDE